MAQIKPMWERLEVTAEKHEDAFEQAEADGHISPEEWAQLKSQALTVRVLAADNSTAQRLIQSLGRGGPHSDYARRQGFRPVAIG